MRVSTGRQAEHDLSIPDQRRQLESWCRAQGCIVASEFIEGGASAGDDRRPVFQQMIERACDGERAFDLILVHSFEGADGFHNRAEAFRRTHAEALGRDLAFQREHGLPEKIRFYLLGSNAKLVHDHKALIESIEGQIDAPPVAVVLDILNRSIDGSESKDADMGAYLAAAEVIAETFDCVVIIVHHCGVAGDRPRGHTSLTGE
jgi:hypothetical protein